MATHEFTFSLSEAERDAVAASLGVGRPDDLVQAYLQVQVATVVAQHVLIAKRAALVADGLSPTLADAGLADDEVAALRAIRADKRAAEEAAR